MKALTRRIGAIRCFAAFLEVMSQQMAQMDPDREGDLMLAMLDYIDWMLVSPEPTSMLDSPRPSPPNPSANGDLPF